MCFMYGLSSCVAVPQVAKPIEFGGVVRVTSGAHHPNQFPHVQSTLLMRGESLFQLIFQLIDSSENDVGIGTCLRPCYFSALALAVASQVLLNGRPLHTLN